MARARAVVGGFLLVLIAAPAHAAPPSHSYGLGELLGPVVAPLEPVTESVDELVAPITEPVGEIPEQVADPVEEVTDPIRDHIDDVTDPDPIVDPVEEVLDPIIDPVEDVIDPPLEPNPPPVDGGNPGSPALSPPGTSATNASQPSVAVSGSLVEALPSSSAVSLVSSAVSLIPPASAGEVLAQALAQSFLSQILDWLGEADAGSFLTAPFLGLQVLLRALVSAGKGLLVPGVMLVAFAFLMARDRRIQGTKTP
jgi:hypothetical protein